MELKTGYKETEIGVIPNDWRVEPFVEITKIITCGLAATPKYVDESVGKPFLSAQNVQNGKVVYDKYRFIPTGLFDQITKHNPPQKGDLLYTRVGAGIGEAGVVEDDFQFGIYVSLTLIRVDEKKLYNYFLLHLLNSPKFRFLAKNGQFAGGGVQNLNVQIVRDFLIPLPKFAEQTSIATALSDTDQYITHLEKLIAKKRNIKQGAMQELLEPKEEWVVKKLGEIAEIRKGEQLNKDTLSETEKYPVMNGGVAPSGYTHKWNENADTIIISEGGNSCGFVNFIKTKFWQGGHCYSIGTKINKLFLYQLLKYNEKLIMGLRVGSGLPNVQRTRLANFELHLPNPETQSRIAIILSDMDSEITTLETKLSKAQSIKQGMMQQLLTGKIRLI